MYKEKILVEGDMVCETVDDAAGVITFTFVSGGGITLRVLPQSIAGRFVVGEYYPLHVLEGHKVRE